MVSEHLSGDRISDNEDNIPDHCVAVRRKMIYSVRISGDSISFVRDKKENNIPLRTTEGNIGARRKPVYGVRISRDDIRFVLNNDMS
jgi:hypothetical protein